MIRQKIQKWKKPLTGGAVMALAVGGLAFALLQSHADLTGNSVQTDSAGLLISRDTNIYSTSVNGYAFTHVVPGFKPSEAEPLFVENTGSAPLSLRLSMAKPPTNPDNVDLSKVDVILTPRAAGTNQAGAPESFPVQSLIDSPSGMPINSPATLAASDHQRFDIQISMDADAANGSAASLSNLDLTFTGVASVND
ncbi:MAG TPA: hypothetical protein VHA05_01465 [Candidatus Saccharimonadales bacterium]|nr:hypothetical protein [Candidatus Saccharimonadales bacterium]